MVGAQREFVPARGRGFTFSTVVRFEYVFPTSSAFVFVTFSRCVNISEHADTPLRRPGETHDFFFRTRHPLATHQTFRRAVRRVVPRRPDVPLCFVIVRRATVVIYRFTRASRACSPIGGRYPSSFCLRLFTTVIKQHASLVITDPTIIIALRYISIRSEYFFL